MSRIHEALRRAEQERGSSQDVARDSAVAVAVAPPATEHPPVRANTGLAAPFSFEQLAANCRKVDWQPDLRTMIAVQGRQAHGMEELRTLRTRLYKIREQQNLRSVLVTSAMPAEGKTFVSANLALTLCSQKEKRVALVDADLRKPRLHVVLGAPPSPGLTDFLTGTADEAAIVQRSTRENLFFVPGGNMVANPADLVASSRMKLLLDRLTSVFDWVIVDSPPAVPVADAHVLSGVCNGTVMVVMAGSTPLDLAQKAVQQFQDRNLLGAVLNRAERGTGYHSYYYQYGYGEKPAGQHND